MLESYSHRTDNQGNLLGREMEPIASSKTPIPADLLHPHYSDRRFRDGRVITVYLAEGTEVFENYDHEEVRGAFYVYSDRLFEAYESDAIGKAFNDAERKIGNCNTAEYFETMLRALYVNPNIELKQILTGINQSTGYSYKVFGTVNPTEVQ